MGRKVEPDVAVWIQRHRSWYPICRQSEGGKLEAIRPASAPTMGLGLLQHPGAILVLEEVHYEKLRRMIRQQRMHRNPNS
jgi:hypothetical protein